MGLEATCVVHRGDRSARAKVLLESNELIVRGDLRTTIPFSEVQSVAVDAGTIAVTTADETIQLELGPSAENWAARMRNPRTLIDKLGLKSEHRVMVINLNEPAFDLQLDARGIVRTEVARDLDAIMLGIESIAELDRLPELRAAIRPNGMIWVVSPKGRPDLRDVDILAAAKMNGLVDNKVAAFNSRLTANKLVIPVQQRSSKSAAVSISN